jgi:hypothetical protein
MSRKAVILTLALVVVASGAYPPGAIRRDGRPRIRDYLRQAGGRPVAATAGIGRAEARAYRDEPGEAMTDPDWSEVECRLRRAYWSLKAAVAGGKP